MLDSYALAKFFSACCFVLENVSISQIFSRIKMNRSVTQLFLNTGRRIFRENKRLSAAAFVVSLSGGGYWLGQRYQQHVQLHKRTHLLQAEAVQADDKLATAEAKPKKKSKRGTSSRMSKAHYDKFASVEVDGSFYMTPRDFIDCVVLDAPRPRIKRRLITNDQLVLMAKNVPRCRSSNTENPNPTLFRDLDDGGVISYVEYLFLLSLLTRPQSGFRIAFDLIDVSAEGTIIKDEFSRFCQLGLSKKKQLIGEAEVANLLLTTLSVHFFGVTGERPLTFGQFSTFLKNFQREMLLTEFLEYSRGLDHISIQDFSEILLKYTTLSNEEKEVFLTRVQELNEEEKGINFHEFEQFTQLLNNLEDFAIAVRLYSISGKGLNRDEFKRAAKICLHGQDLPDHVVNAVFKLFDRRGDDKLGYDEFILVMRNRLRRKLKSPLERKSGFAAFRSCMRSAIRESSSMSRATVF